MADLPRVVFTLRPFPVAVALWLGPYPVKL